jgi:hypothetical protein
MAAFMDDICVMRDDGLLQSAPRAEMFVAIDRTHFKQDRRADEGIPQQFGALTDSQPPAHSTASICPLAEVARQRVDPHASIGGGNRLQPSQRLVDAAVVEEAECDGERGRRVRRRA